MTLPEQLEVQWVSASHLPLKRLLLSSLRRGKIASLWWHLLCGYNSLWMPKKDAWGQGWKDSVMPEFSYLSHSHWPEENGEKVGEKMRNTLWGSLDLNPILARIFAMQRNKHLKFWSFPAEFLSSPKVPIWVLLPDAHVNTREERTTASPTAHP
jgi:hypothetical protein